MISKITPKSSAARNQFVKFCSLSMREYHTRRYVTPAHELALTLTSVDSQATKIQGQNHGLAIEEYQDYLRCNSNLLSTKFNTLNALFGHYSAVRDLPDFAAAKWMQSLEERYERPMTPSTDLCFVMACSPSYLKVPLYTAPIINHLSTKFTVVLQHGYNYEMIKMQLDTPSTDTDLLLSSMVVVFNGETRKLLDWVSKEEARSYLRGLAPGHLLD